MKIYILLLALLTAAPCTAQDFSTYEGRRQWLLNSLKDVKLTDRGKQDLPKACVRLWGDPRDAVALEYITTILDHKNQSMFDFPGVALALGMFRDSFNPAQIAAIKADLERLAKPDKGGGEGFLGHGTENHALMMWCSGYLFGQWFPDAKWANGMTSPQLMADLKERLRKTFRSVYQKGYTEFLSTTYDVVLTVPATILYKYAEDPEVRGLAEAYLLYKWALSALNNFEGQIIAPYSRSNRQQDTEPKDVPCGSAVYHWLLWGWGPATPKVKADLFKLNATQWTVAAALLDVPLPDFFNRVAGNSLRPYQHLSSASTFGTYGSGVPHMMMRKVYRHPLFAIGTGNFRWVPGGDYADHDAVSFNIVWSSADRFRYLECNHPYWYSDGDLPERHPDAWSKGSISPFQQTAHHGNTAIVLYNIPEKDPWPGKPSPDKWAWRDGHAEKLLARGQFRYPKSMDETVEKGGWIFLREGKVYIAAKPLRDYYLQTNVAHQDMEGFNVVKSDFSRCGFVFEVGAETEFGSFASFQDRIARNALEIDWDKLTVSYTNTQKDTLEIQYRSGLPEVVENPVPEHWVKKGFKSMAESVPLVAINGKEDPRYRVWPVIGSPWINLKDGVLEINDGKAKVTVDWRGEYPTIRRQ